MARFFFDSLAGAARVPDDIGLELPDFEAARQHALAGLLDLVREEIGTVATSFAILVRDEAGTVHRAGEVIPDGAGVYTTIRTDIVSHGKVRLLRPGRTAAGGSGGAAAAAGQTGAREVRRALHALHPHGAARFALAGPARAGAPGTASARRSRRTTSTATPISSRRICRN